MLLIYFTKMDATSILHVSLPEDQHEDMLVLYPTDPLDSNCPLNASIRYYLSAKDDLKLRDDDHAVENKQKTIVPFERHRDASESHLILEYTHVFGQPRFCSFTDEQIFGRSCPFTNW